MNPPPDRRTVSPARSRAAADRATGTRMSAEERRELVLEAATRAFARGGFAGTSTDAVAKQAGVSQPYVVRIFGTKQDLFLEVFARAGRRIEEAFGEVLAAPGFDGSREEHRERLGEAYTGLLADRDMMLCLMHGYTAGDNEAIGAVGRATMGRIFAALTGSGMTDDEARDFIAYGMLLNTLMAMRAPEHAGDADADGLAGLATCVFGTNLETAKAAAR